MKKIILLTFLTILLSLGNVYSQRSGAICYPKQYKRPTPVSVKYHMKLQKELSYDRYVFLREKEKRKENRKKKFNNLLNRKKPKYRYGWRIR